MTHRSAAITSIAALIGVSIALIAGKGYESADDWAALFAAIFILYNSYHIFRPALGEIMDEHIYDEQVDLIRKVAKTVEGIINTEKCFIRKVGMKYHVELHATVDAAISVKEGHELGHVLIHIEPNE